MIKKLLRIFLLAIAMVALIFSIAAVIFRILLPTDKIKAMALNQARGYLRRDISIENVSVGLLEGIKLTGISVKDKKPFEKETFLECERFALKIRPLPLLRQELIISDVKITKPRITVKRFSDGSYNIANILNAAKVWETRQQQKPAGRRVYLLPLLLISKLTVENGSINFIDIPSAQQSFSIKNLNLQLKNIFLKRPFAADISLEIEKCGYSWPFSFSGSVDISTKTIAIDNLTAGPKGFSLKAAGGITGFDDPEKFRYYLDVSGENLSVGNLAAFLKLEGKLSGLASVKSKLRGTGLTLSSLCGDATISAKNLKLDGTKLAESLALAAGDPSLKEISFAEVRSDIKIKNGVLNFTEMRTTGGNNLDIGLSGKADLTKAEYDMRGSIRFAKNYSTGAIAKYQSDEEGRVSIPFNLTGGFASPKFNLEWDKIINRAIQKTAEEFFRKDGQKFLEQFFIK